MIKSQFVKPLIILGFISILAVSCAAWKINKDKDVDKNFPTDDQLSVKKDIQKSTSPIPEKRMEKGQSKVGESTSPAWIVYENRRYHYRLSYPKGSVTSLNLALPQADISDTISIDIDPEKLGMTVCTEDNLEGFSSKRLFELWTNVSPPQSPPCPCGTFKKNLLSVSETTISGIPVYQAKIFAYDSNTFCYYLANSKLLMALCIPEEDPTEPSWQERFKTYKEVISTLKFLE